MTSFDCEHAWKDLYLKDEIDIDRFEEGIEMILVGDVIPDELMGGVPMFRAPEMETRT